MESIGTRIARYRELRGLSQEDLAKKVGVHAQTVSKWERGIQAVAGRYIGPLAEVLSVSADELTVGAQRIMLREDRPEYGASKDRVDQLIDMLSRPEMLRRMAGKIPRKDLAAMAIQTAIDEGWPEDELDRVYAWAKELLKDDGSQDGG